MSSNIEGQDRHVPGKIYQGLVLWPPSLSSKHHDLKAYREEVCKALRIKWPWLGEFIDTHTCPLLFYPLLRIFLAGALIYKLRGHVMPVTVPQAVQTSHELLLFWLIPQLDKLPRVGGSRLQGEGDADGFVDGGQLILTQCVDSRLQP